MGLRKVLVLLLVLGWASVHPARAVGDISQNEARGRHQADRDTQRMLGNTGREMRQSPASTPNGKEWCYTEADCGPLTWSTLGFCNASRQSPVNINDSLAVFNSSLSALKFTGYGNVSQLLSITNLGHTVEVELAGGASIAGGGLQDVYSAVAFHFHWGNGSSQPGSEHRINGKQFPMEMHIVHTKQGMNLTQAKKDPTGIAVLAFFLDVSEAASANAFLNLTSLLSSIRDPDGRFPRSAAKQCYFRRAHI
ncbi:carbonic anhydrase 4-like isoform X2 [Ambystoma mexicanum]|uniref:carbonic anhydrase 4-like isoform X2 n=1 Tax=Ambystoma mexicanum TaxID=8296 RepID=UPI0037E86634